MESRLIKLNRSNPPAELTPKLAQELTEIYKTTKEAVWQKDYIKRALLAQSHNKCSFCECELGEESKYLEVEHFAFKDTYPDEVVSWNNLLASCKRCNLKKGVLDVRIDPIVNPYDDDPRAHLRMQAYRMQSKTHIGELTIEQLGLNDIERTLTPRFKIGTQICENLDKVKDRLNSYLENSTPLRMSKLKNALSALLNECLGQKPYAATSATVLHTESIYPVIRQRLEELGLWSDDFQRLHTESLALVMQ